MRAVEMCKWQRELGCQVMVIALMEDTSLVRWWGSVNTCALWKRASTWMVAPVRTIQREHDIPFQ